MPFLAGPYEVEPLVLVGEIGTLQKDRGVFAEFVRERRVEISLRRLIHFQAGDAAHLVLHRPLGPIIVRSTRLEALTLEPQDQFPDSVELSWNGMACPA